MNIEKNKLFLLTFQKGGGQRTIAPLSVRLWVRRMFVFSFYCSFLYCQDVEHLAHTGRGPADHCHQLHGRRHRQLHRPAAGGNILTYW